MIKPKKIVEFGILDGYSLEHFLINKSNECYVEAYDIFDEFNGNCADYNLIKNKFNSYKNLLIKKLDFYQTLDYFEDNSIDILHIDIANDGNVFEFAINNYINKLSKNGVIILEGGSIERDNIEWMIKYNKRPINPVIQKYKDKFNIKVIDKYPSMTIIIK